MMPSALGLLKAGLRPIWRRTFAPLRPKPAPRPVPPAICPDPANQLFFLIALPKSAGQAMRAMLNRCRVAGPQREFIPESLQCPNNLHVEMPLTDRLLAEFPNGGWNHTHAPATLMTMDFLHRHRIRHLIQFRHPLDQIAAYYCHLVKHRGLAHSMSAWWRPTVMLTNPLAPVPAEAMREGTTRERAFDLFLEHGYFEAVLDWIGQWCAFRSPQLSRIFTYESLIADPRAELLRAVEFLRPMLDVPKAGIETAVGEMDSYVRLSRDLESRTERSAYTQGYTGRIGIHREYLTPGQIERAKVRYERYCRESVYGPHLREWYPVL